MAVADGGKSCLIVVDDSGVLDRVAGGGEVRSC
jgi:hypothetical protein